MLSGIVGVPVLLASLGLGLLCQCGRRAPPRSQRARKRRDAKRARKAAKRRKLLKRVRLAKGPKEERYTLDPTQQVTDVDTQVETQKTVADDKTALVTCVAKTTKSKKETTHKAKNGAPKTTYDDNNTFVDRTIGGVRSLKTMNDGPPSAEGECEFVANQSRSDS